MAQKKYLAVIPSDLSPKRDCSPKRVFEPFSAALCRNIYLTLTPSQLAPNGIAVLNGFSGPLRCALHIPHTSDSNSRKVICHPNGTAALNGFLTFFVLRCTETHFWLSSPTIVSMSPKRDCSPKRVRWRISCCTVQKPTADLTLFPSNLSPKRNCSPKRVF